MKATSDGGFFFACASDGAFTVGCGSFAGRYFTAIAARFYRWLWKCRLGLASPAERRAFTVGCVSFRGTRSSATARRFHRLLWKFRRNMCSCHSDALSPFTVELSARQHRRRHFALHHKKSHRLRWLKHSNAHQSINAAYPPPLPRPAAWAPACRARR